MKYSSLTPYQAVESFIATLNPSLRTAVVDNDVMLRHMINAYVDAMVELGRMTRYDAASAALNARWMANSIVQEIEDAEAHA